MFHFMIYLLETGICLSLLYLAYWLFLRKETYFNFNRLFLVCSIWLALAVPILHHTINITLGSSLENPARNILKIRHSYAELIRYIDADFGTEPGLKHSAGRSSMNGGVEEEGLFPAGSRHESMETSGEESGPGIKGSKRNRISISRILFFIYIGGVFYFFARFVYLVIRLYLLAKRNRVSQQDGFRMVEIEEEISPFSFFRFLFINNGVFDESELHHVLEHEKAHIRQRHTTDHLFAHGLAVFQWFNPFAWQMRKALKSTHEFIADRQVIDKGFERIDYQALLLKQVIGYHSVELVNNFNLKPIKKRIAMMNKTKSGLPAKLKAILVAPFAILIFFLFADFTLKGTDNSLTYAGDDLQGLWISESKDSYKRSILIEGDVFSFTEGVEIRNFNLRITENDLILSRRPEPTESALKYECKGDRLTLWWNDERSSQYLRSKAGNTLDQFLLEKDLQLDLPSISQYRLMDDEAGLYRLGMGKKTSGETFLTFDGEPISIDMLPDRVKKERQKMNKIDQSSLTAIFLVDRSVSMEEVHKVRGVLRDLEALHIAEGGYPHGDLNLSPLIYHAVALPRLLPPLNAKTLDIKEAKKYGTDLYIIDLAARNTNPRDLDNGLRDFIKTSGNGKYVISLEYDGTVPYGQYVETVDMVWRIVYSYRNSLAMERYSAPYDRLGDDLQREIRKAFPMALSELMK